MAEWRLEPIGVIRSPFGRPSEAPIQPVFASGAKGRVELFPEYEDGLADIGGFTHVHLLYVFHLSKAVKLRIRPYLQEVERGVFATRAPCRPNRIGLSVVRLVRREGNVLHVEDVDVVDGTPLLDVKPFCPRFDAREGAGSGWLGQVDDATAEKRGRVAGRDLTER